MMNSGAPQICGAGHSYYVSPYSSSSAHEFCSGPFETYEFLNFTELYDEFPLDYTNELYIISWHSLENELLFPI